MDELRINDDSDNHGRTKIDKIFLDVCAGGISFMIRAARHERIELAGIQGPLIKTPRLSRGV